METGLIAITWLGALVRIHYHTIVLQSCGGCKDDENDY